MNKMLLGLVLLVPQVASAQVPYGAVPPPPAPRQGPNVSFQLSIGNRPAPLPYPVPVPRYQPGYPVNRPIPVPVYRPVPVVRPVPYPVYSPPFVPPAPVHQGPMTLRHFAKCFVPTGGHHEVVLIHPVTGHPVQVCFDLPHGRPEIDVESRSIEFDYGREEIKIHFERNGGYHIDHDD